MVYILGVYVHDDPLLHLSFAVSPYIGDGVDHLKF
jgi:hypothetical protein